MQPPIEQKGRSSEELYRMRYFHRWKEWKQRCYSREKRKRKQVGCCHVTFLEGMSGSTRRIP